MLIAHKLSTDTVRFTFAQPVSTPVGSVPADNSIKINGQIVIFVTFVSSTVLDLQFAGSVSVGFPAVITGTPVWMTPELQPATVPLT